MIENQIAETEKKNGIIKEIVLTVEAHISTARDISQRLQDLRGRLIGDKCEETEKSVTDGPMPVLSETEELSERLDVMRQIMEESLNDLAALERL